MMRNLMNRWWTLALALVLGVAGVVFLPGLGRAAGGNTNQIGGDPGMGPGPGDPSGGGDPDVPINTKSNSKNRPLGNQLAAPLAPGMSVGSAPKLTWLFQFRTALLLFRVYLVR